ncbi:hypothetical protein OY671_012354, partial [Metschnikowia pulcherrima]
QKNASNQRISAGRQIIENSQFKYAADKREKERQRLQKEAEERAALEASARENNLETALPPAPEPEPAPIKAAPIRSDDGATVSLGVEYVTTVTDSLDAKGNAERKANRSAEAPHVQHVVRRVVPRV